MVVKGEVTAGKGESPRCQLLSSLYGDEAPAKAAGNSRGDDIDTGVLDGSPASETSLLGDLLKLLDADLVGPVSLGRFLDLTLSTDARESENSGLNHGAVVW